MKAEIISIGDEILIGQITNTNSVWIAQQLNLIGIGVESMITIADERNSIMRALEDSCNRSEFVFITGGLGPTKDDITKKVFADFFNVNLLLNEDALKDVSEFFRSRGRELSDLNRQQALLPEGCVMIRNKNGTAPGMWMKKENTTFISMPGVPYEMKGMMTDIILPKIKNENALPFIYHKTILTQGLGESIIAEMLEKWEDTLPAKGIKLAYLPQPGIVRLRLSCTGKEQNSTIKAVEEESKIPMDLLSGYVYGTEKYGEDSPRLEKILSDTLRSKKKTLALAESCTGGFISSLITSLPGASEVFRGGMVPYTNEAKHQLLEVEQSVFANKGAVSKECVEQLAKNVLNKFNADYSIAVSGIAGPTGGTNEKPVGFVWIAVADRTRVFSKEFRFGNDRQRNIAMTANAALNMLLKFIPNEKDRSV